MTAAVGSSGRDNTFDDETKKSALRGRFFFFALADFRCKVFDRLGACFLATLAPFPRACQHCARVCGASRFDAPYVRSFCLLVAELLPPLRQEGGQGLIAERTPADAAGSKMRRHFDRRWWAKYNGVTPSPSPGEGIVRRRYPRESHRQDFYSNAFRATGNSGTSNRTATRSATGLLELGPRELGVDVAFGAPAPNPFSCTEFLIAVPNFACAHIMCPLTRSWPQSVKNDPRHHFQKVKGEGCP